MVLKKIIRLLCLINLLLIAGCKKQKLTGDLELLVGNWVWHEAWYYNGSTTWMIENQSSKGGNNTMLIEKKGKVTLFENGKKKKKYRVTKVYSEFIDTGNKWEFDVYFAGDAKTTMIYHVGSGMLEVFSFFLIEGDGLSGSITSNYFYKQP